MNLKEFIKNHNVDYSYSKVDEAFLQEFECSLEIEIGEQLRNYILNYGYLGYKYIELFGINSIQGMKSDMVKKTRFLHEHFDATKDLIAIEDQGDGDYYLVDSNDMVFRFLDGDESLTATDKKLNEYILERFQSAI